jgi:hypothetical protein
MSGWTSEVLGEAGVVSLEPNIDKNGDHYLPLLYVFPTENGGSISENSGLVRPFKKL